MKTKTIPDWPEINPRHKIVFFAHWPPMKDSGASVFDGSIIT